MEASGAGLEGNGIVVVCGQFEPGAVIELRERAPGTFRSEGGNIRGRRAADSNGDVGFDGLEPSAKFWVSGFTAGRFVELPVVAQDPALGLTLLQPPQGPIPTTLGYGQTPAPDVPPAPTAEDIPVGLPAGVENPILRGPDEQLPADAPEVVTEIGAEGGTSGGVVATVTENTPTAETVAAPTPVEASPEAAPVESAPETVPEPPVEVAPAPADVTPDPAAASDPAAETPAEPQPEAAPSPAPAEPEQPAPVSDAPAPDSAPTSSPEPTPAESAAPPVEPGSAASAPTPPDAPAPADQEPPTQ